MNSFSIIIPTYNRSFLLMRAIRTALEQKYNNYEIIIINDASTDNTSNLLKKYFHECIKIIENKENMGAAQSKNIGIKHATKDWIVFLDSDDMYSQKSLGKFNKCINNNPNIDFFHYNPNIIGEPDIPNQEDLSLGLCNINNCIIGGTFILNREKIQKYNLEFPPVKYANDYQFYKLAVKTNINIMKITDGTLKDCYYYDRISSTSSITKKHKCLLQNTI